MTYAAQLAFKRDQVRGCLGHIAGLDVEVQPVLGMDDPSAYRNKTALPAGGSVDAPILGFYAPRSHRIVPAASCPNALPPAGDIAQAFLDWMKTFRIPPYQEEAHRGLLRHLVIRVNRRGEAMVTVVVNGDTLPHLRELRERIEPLGAVSLILNRNQTRTNVILSDHFQSVYGKPTLPDTLCGLRFELSPASFFQINPCQTERLYETALSFADLKPEETLCDVYCGAGTITLMMARHCARAIGIEIIPTAVENARENAARNGIGHAEFHTGQAEKLLPEMVEKGLRPDVIVVDPPRRGLDLPVIDAIAKAAPSRLVYISCNPATQARDAALLLERCYAVRQIQPVDMFPWTSHVETVCLLSKLSEQKIPPACSKGKMTPPDKTDRIEKEEKPCEKTCTLCERLCTAGVQNQEAGGKAAAEAGSAPRGNPSGG